MYRVVITKVLVAAGMLVASSQIYATQLNPGGTVVNPGTTSAPGGSPIAIDPITLTQGGLNDGFNWKNGKGKPNESSGNYVNAVYVDPVTHELDFYYQIQNTFAGNATGQNTLSSTFMISDFAGFTIFNVLQLQSSVAGNFFGDGSSDEFKGKTQVSIVDVKRSANGSNIVVDLSSVVKPGQNTAVLLLKTNAKNFDQGTSSFNWKTPPSGCPAIAQATGNCGNAYKEPFFLNNLEPFQAPEPGFYGMLSLGIAGLFFVVRRRRTTTAV
ncbi:MAG: hypothetical protein JWO80_73 [Bryobacterales bacterium]|nr:hypothetical protein [Bryobacterales bacterium]